MTREERAREVLADQVPWGIDKNDIDSGCSILAKEAIAAMIAFANSELRRAMEDIKKRDMGDLNREDMEVRRIVELIRDMMEEE